MDDFSLVMCNRCQMILNIKKSFGLDIYDYNCSKNKHLNLCPQCASDVYNDIIGYRYLDIFKKVEE